MTYDKCRRCEFVCRCCSSKHWDNYPRCQSCEGPHDEFKPAKHVIHCPVDRTNIKDENHDQ